MKKLHGQFISVAIAAASLFLAGCNKPSSVPGAGGDTIKIGEFASMTGSEATFGQSSHNGTLLAIEDLNAAGGILGKKVELLMEDDQSQAGQPATVEVTVERSGRRLTSLSSSSRLSGGRAIFRT